MIDKDTYLRFCDEALVAMRDIVVDLGDDLANQRPDLPGANSPFAILTHCLGVTARWASTVNLGEVVPRDRDAEFTATGRRRGARRRHRPDAGVVAGVGRPHRPRRAARPTRRSPRQDWYAATQGGVLLHVYEELAQHRGQLEVTRDVLRAAAG